jgi:predicted nucleotidyltransferase component of viral defense system
VSSEKKSNPAASIRARLLRLAQQSGEDYQRVLGRYGIERFLYRLGQSSYRDRFALKGATLFTLWTGRAHRPTRDLDLLGWGSSDTGDVETAIRTIAEMHEEDGVLFDPSSVQGTAIKEADEYDGVRVKFSADLDGARIPMQVDIGFGDAVYPDPRFADFPVLLQMPAPRIRAYPRESAVAEKLHAMVALGIRNTRMKDFYDVWFMATTWEFDLETLYKAIETSFKRRGIAVPQALPFALTEDFVNDAQKRQQWRAFTSRLNPGENAPSLSEVGELLRTFLEPCFADNPLRSALHWGATRQWIDHPSSVS